MPSGPKSSLQARRVAREAAGAAKEGVAARDTAVARDADEAKGMGAGIRGADTARAAVVAIITTMGAVGTATAAITADMAGAAIIRGTVGAIGIGALAGN